MGTEAVSVSAAGTSSSAANAEPSIRHPHKVVRVLIADLSHVRHRVLLAFGRAADRIRRGSVVNAVDALAIRRRAGMNPRHAEHGIGDRTTQTRAGVTGGGNPALWGRSVYQGAGRRQISRLTPARPGTEPPS